jgi:hypothetical protein
MPTGQMIINNALTALGILEQGGAPSVSDSNDALAELNAMWDAWGIDDNIVYAIATAQYALVANAASYPIGPAAGAPYNVPRPSRIYKAVMVATVGGVLTRRPLRIVEAGEYFSHGDLAATASTADELYYDYNVDPTTGSATLYLWPAPSCPTITKLELETGAVFAAWTLGGAYSLPEGYQDAIQYALAWRLLPRYGMAVAQQVAEVVGELAEKSEARIKAMNAANRQKPMPAPAIEAPAGKAV